MTITPRQAEIVAGVLQGLANKEIADRLKISEKTVKFHLTNTYSRLRIRNRHHLLVSYHKGNLPEGIVSLVVEKLPSILAAKAPAVSYPV